MADRISEAFAKIAALAAHDGVKAINELEGCWEREIGEWWIAVNGHTENTACSRGASVWPFNCYVEFNGWPAGMFDPYCGIIVASGEAANEDALIAAIDALLDNPDGT